MYEIIREIISSYKNNAEQVLNGKSNFNRSPKKVDGIHGKIAADLNRMIKEQMEGKDKTRFYAISKISNKKEGKAAGLVNTKNADVLIIDQRSNKNNVVALIEVKAPLSSIQKNKHNYIENGTGECVNIKISKKLYYELYAVPVHAPDFTQTRDAKHEKIVKAFASDAGKIMIDAANKRMYIGRIDKFAAPDSMALLCIKSPEIEDIRNKRVSQTDFSKKVQEFYTLGKDEGSYKKFYATEDIESQDSSLKINDYEDWLRSIVSDLKREKWEELK